MKRSPLPILDGERMPFTFGPIVDTFSYYDGPLLFTLKDTIHHNLHLVTWHDCDEDQNRYLAVEITPERLNRFLTKQFDIFTAFNVDPLYSCDYGPEKTMVVTRIQMSQIPREQMPKDGVFCSPDEEE